MSRLAHIGLMSRVMALMSSVKDVFGLYRGGARSEIGTEPRNWGIFGHAVSTQWGGPNSPKYQFCPECNARVKRTHRFIGGTASLEAPCRPRNMRRRGGSPRPPPTRTAARCSTAASQSGRSHSKDESEWTKLGCPICKMKGRTR